MPIIEPIVFYLGSGSAELLNVTDDEGEINIDLANDNESMDANLRPEDVLQLIEWLQRWLAKTPS